MALRKFQKEIAGICREMIEAGPSYSKERLVVLVTPGGGKSIVPAQFIPVAKAWGTKICWVVPRKSLQTQGEKQFVGVEDGKPSLARILAGGEELLAVEGNAHAIDPSRGYAGYIISNQALESDRQVSGDEIGINEYEFLQNDYILIIDEFHHMMEGRAWSNAIQPLVDRCKFLVLMSGTPRRHQGGRVSFANMIQTERENLRGKKTLTYETSTESDEFQVVVNYSRQDALREQAIIPLHCVMVDGQVKWENIVTEEKTVIESFQEFDKGLVGRVIGNAFKSQYFEDLLNRGLNHFKRWALPGSKVLIVLPKWGLEERTMKVLDTHKLKSVTVKGKMSRSEQDEQIHKLESNFCDVLITVAVAYEGLDVKAIKYVIFLSDIRSIPWVEQALARACRVLKGVDYDQQWGTVFCPDDPMMQECIAQIASDQDEILKDRGRQPTVLKVSSREGDDHEQDENLDILGGKEIVIKPLDEMSTWEDDEDEDPPVPPEILKYDKDKRRFPPDINLVFNVVSGATGERILMETDKGTVNVDAADFWRVKDQLELADIPATNIQVARMAALEHNEPQPVGTPTTVDVILPASKRISELKTELSNLVRTVAYDSIQQTPELRKMAVVDHDKTFRDTVQKVWMETNRHTGKRKVQYYHEDDYRKGCRYLTRKLNGV